jgi:AraC family transcriptional regulator
MLELAPITLGRTLRVARSESFIYTETEHLPETSLDTHAHENPAISFVLGGKRIYRFGGRAFDCRAGSAVFVPAGAPHSSRFAAERGRGLMLEVRRPSADLNTLFGEPRRSCDVDLAERCDGIRGEIWFPDDVSSLALESLGFELLVAEARAARDPRGIPRWLDQVRGTLQESFKAPPSLATLAVGAGVDRSRLTREFRRHFHSSIGEYVRAIRVRHAWELIVCSNRPLCEVAVECGFADQSHLTRVFRRAYGTTPGRFRLDSASAVPSMPRAFNTRRRAIRTLGPCERS